MKQRWTQIVALGVAGACLAGSALLAVRISASAGRNRLVYTDTAEKGAPEQVGLGIAMGAFRGMFVNFLWIRANQLKEDGRYYEAIDLAKAITALQPRYPHAWVFHAWNLAYNISVNTYTNRERYRWVSAGIDLLRGQAVVYNPNDLMIHRELAWIFLHKIGGVMDDGNLYYKRQLAAEWTFVLGPPPPRDAADRDGATAKAKWIEWFRPVVDAPDTLEAVLAKEPLVAELISALQAEGQMEPDNRLARNYTTMTVLLKTGEAIAFERAFDDRRRVLAKYVKDPRFAKAWAALIPHLRKRMLTDRYNMEPARMLRYMETFGPLDWRHHATHSLYWAQKGVDNARTRFTAENRQDFDFVNSGRMVIQSLQDLWRTGDLYFDFIGFVKNPDDERVFWRGSPSIAFIDAYGDYLNRHIEAIVKDDELAKVNRFEDPRARGFTLYAAGYENFRKDAIRFLYRRGEIARADKMKDELAVWPWHNTNDPSRAALFGLPLTEFVEKELADQLTRPSVVREEIVGALQGAFINGILGGDSELFRQQMTYAGNVHSFYYKAQNNATYLDPTAGRMSQFPRNFALMSGMEFAFMCQALDLDAAETLYDGAPEDLKRWAYDIMVEKYKVPLDQLAKEIADPLRARPFDKVFPEPSGMAQHREERDRMIAAERENAPQLDAK